MLSAVLLEFRRTLIYRPTSDIGKPVVLEMNSYWQLLTISVGVGRGTPATRLHMYTLIHRTCFTAWNVSMFEIFDS